MNRFCGKSNRIFAKWAGFQIKRNLLSPSYYVLVIFMILGILLIRGVSREYSKSVDTLILNEGSEAGEKVLQRLVSDPPEGFNFIQVDDETYLIDKVTRGEVACGVIFTPELDMALANENYDGEVIYYQYAGSVDGYVVKEIIFPELQRYGCKGTVEKYLESMEVDDSVKKEVVEYNSSYLDGTSLQLFSIVDVGSGQLKENRTFAFDRLAYAFLIAIISLIVIMDCICQDDNFYIGIPRVIREFMRCEAVLVNIIMTIGVGLIVSRFFW